MINTQINKFSVNKQFTKQKVQSMSNKYRKKYFNLNESLKKGKSNGQ